MYISNGSKFYETGDRVRIVKEYNEGDLFIADEMLDFFGTVATIKDDPDNDEYGYKLKEDKRGWWFYGELIAGLAEEGEDKL